MFRGGSGHSIDDKGRVILPQKLRSLLGDKFVITKGLDRCLWIFTDDGFLKLEERLKAQPMLDQDAVRLTRFFCGEAEDAKCDSQGRVAIPANLREYASIEREVMIIGATNRIEIWSKSKWDEINNTTSDDLIRESAREIGVG